MKSKVMCYMCVLYIHMQHKNCVASQPCRKCSSFAGIAHSSNCFVHSGCGKIEECFNFDADMNIICGENK